MTNWKPLLVLLIVLRCDWSLRAQDNEQPPDWRSQALAAERAFIAKVEEDLAAEEKLLAMKVSTEGDVDRVRVQLAQARHDLALHEDRRDVVREQLRVVVELRQRQLDRLQQARRPEQELTQARRRLAN